MSVTEKKPGGFVGKAKLIAAATVLSRVLGVLRETVFSHVFGIDTAMGSFAVAYMIPNLFRRLFGEGALSAAFIPVYSETMESGDKELSQRLGRATLWLLVVTLAGVVLVGEAIILGLGWFFGDNPHTALTLILAAMVLPYVVLICLVALMGGMLNARYHFSCPALAPVVLNVFLIIAGIWGTGLLGEDKSRQIFAIAAGVLVGGVAQLTLVLVPLKRMGVSLGWMWQPQMEQIKRIIKLTGPMVLGLAVLQVNALMDYLLASWLSGEPSEILLQLGSWKIPYPEETGAVSVLYYAQRLYNMPLGVFGIALATAIFPYFAACAGRKDHAGLIKTLLKGLRLVAFIGIAATVGLIIISQPVVEFILGGGLSGLFGFGPGEFGALDVQRVNKTLIFYCLGIWAYCGVHVVVRGFYALQDTLTPVKVGVWLVALNIPLNLILIWPLGTGGLALSTAICAALNLAILTRLLSRKIEKLPVSAEHADKVQAHQPLREVAAALPKIILATALMGAAAYGALVVTTRWVGSGVGQSGVRLGAAVLAGVVVYYLAARLLGCKELDELLGRDS
ncbi:MAG: murein biosynthesis integral membrane protein MurJ [Phycisphaerae bacterium]|nr:murein biosynthesis integral membrane protein MurJ [Phycisphaerae bacterium]